MEKTITQSKAAKHLGITPHTLRNYEKKGLIQKVSAGTGTKPRYLESDISQLFKKSNN